MRLNFSHTIVARQTWSFLGQFLVISQVCVLCAAQSAATKPQPQNPVDRYYSELQKHALSHGEKVEEQKIVFKDGASIVVRHYPTDHCTEIIKKEGNAPSQTLWLYNAPFPEKPGVKPSAKEQSPAPKPMSLKRYEGTTSRFVEIALVRRTIPNDLHNALFQLIPPPPGPGSCWIPPHPGLPAIVWNYPNFIGNQTIWGTYADGCQFWQAHNVFSGAFGPVHWTYCTHYQQ